MEPNSGQTSQNGKEICMEGSGEEEMQNSMADSYTKRLRHCSCSSVTGKMMATLTEVGRLQF